MISCIVAGWYQVSEQKMGNIPNLNTGIRITSNTEKNIIFFALKLSILIASIVFVTGICLGAGIVSRLRAGRPWKLGAIPCMKKVCSLFPVVQVGSRTHSASNAKFTKSC